MKKMFIFFVGFVGSVSLYPMNNDQLQQAQEFQDFLRAQSLMRLMHNVQQQQVIDPVDMLYIEENAVRRRARLDRNLASIQRDCGLQARPLRSRSNSFDDQVAQAVEDLQNRMDVVEMLENLDMNQVQGNPQR